MSVKLRDINFVIKMDKNSPDMPSPPPPPPPPPPAPLVAGDGHVEPEATFGATLLHPASDWIF